MRSLFALFADIQIGYFLSPLFTNYSPIAVHDSCITHHIIDRPKLPSSYNSYPKSREYIQPQWIFDCSNFRFLLPVRKYGVGNSLPPHLSPWVNDEEEGYKPAYAEEIEKLKNGEVVSEEDEAMTDEEQDNKSRERLNGEGESDSDEGSSSSEEVEEEDEVSEEALVDEKKKKTRKEDDEAKELAKLMMSKKAKRLYGRMQYGIAEKRAKVDILKRKRAEIEQSREKDKAGRSFNKQKVDRLKKERRELEKQYDDIGASMSKKKSRKKGK